MMITSTATKNLQTNEQVICYSNIVQTNEIIERLQHLPPLVASHDIYYLQKLLHDAELGKYLILHAGYCAEQFIDCDKTTVMRQLELLQRMAKCIQKKRQIPVIIIGRIAGQYAKPRSQCYEEKNGVKLLNYRGDLINQITFSAHARHPDPTRMLTAYECTQKTLFYIQTYNETSQMKFPIFASHEALHLPYEQALSRTIDGVHYNLSTHMPWLGMRTGQLEGVHLEYLQQIANPIGIKIGPQATPDWLISIVKKLNPNNIAGKLCCITRLGFKKVATLLPQLIGAIQKHKLNVTWSCDPMHGNSIHSQYGRKTRDFEQICLDLKYTAQIHQRMNSYLAGTHLELTAEHVTECLGGSVGIIEKDLLKAYRSPTDPRLNLDQALQIAQIIGDL